MSTVGDLVGTITMTAVLVGLGVLVGVYVGRVVTVAVGTAAVLLADRARAVDWTALVATAFCVAR